MDFRFICRPVDRDAQSWADLLFGRAGNRALRLSRLRGERLAQSMTGEKLCRELLDQLRPGVCLSVEEDASGRPFLPDCPLFLSISHSASWAAATAADVPVGIDLQEHRPISPGVLRRCFSPAEQRWISEGNSVERATRLWTMKEAYGKMRGIGIFRGKPFAASFALSQPVTQYVDVRFLFPEAPEGFCLTLCLLSVDGF